MMYTKINCVLSPCKDCKDRKVACWDSCEKYKAFKKELEKEKQMIREKKLIESYGRYSRRK